MAATEEAFGKLNALFNNAGIVAFAGVEDCSVEDFRRVQYINVLGVFLGIKTCAAALRRAGGGAIINNSSTAGMQGICRYRRLCRQQMGGAGAVEGRRSRPRARRHPGRVASSGTDPHPDDR